MRKLLFLSVALLGMSGLLTSCVEQIVVNHDFWSRLSKVEQTIWTDDVHYIVVETIIPSGAYTLNGSVLLKHEIFTHLDYESTGEISYAGTYYDYSELETPTPDPRFSELLSLGTTGYQEPQPGKEVQTWKCYQYQYNDVEPEDCIKVDQFKGIDIYLLDDGKSYCYFDNKYRCFALNKMQNEKGNTVYWSALIGTYKYEREIIQVL